MIPAVSRNILVAVVAVSAVASAIGPNTDVRAKAATLHSSSFLNLPAAVTSRSLTVTPMTVVVGGSATVLGSGFTPNSRAFAFWRRPDGTRRRVLVMTSPTGTFSFTLRFAPVHGIGTELVAATDIAAGMTTPAASVTVAARGMGSGMLSASKNPVHVGGVTLIMGRGFTPRTVVVVQWRRPDGTMAAIRVRTGGTGAFAFRLFADPRHGCGTRTFTALDLATLLVNGPGQFALGETC